MMAVSSSGPSTATESGIIGFIIVRPTNKMTFPRRLQYLTNTVKKGIFAFRAPGLLGLRDL